ncbi:protein CLMP1-like isoform X2 [Cynara cardunculus var. scolymus]|nr:protein CLMP1-like isoform X2 [Cynara cardunculus var. scolymus]
MYVRAILRRARAYEAVGKYDMALLDVQRLLGVEPNHRDALEIARRLRTPINGARQESQQDLQSRPSPAALGASAVRGAPIGGLGPCLPARPVPKKPGPSGTVGAANRMLDKTYPVPSTENEVKPTQMPKLVLKPEGGCSNKSDGNPEKSNKKEHMGSSVLPTSDVLIQWRPLKLVYANDIRLAQMPVSCTFKVLREVVSKRFPSSKSVLIKFKDNDGDLVTVTCTSELRLAESIADSLVLNKDDVEKFDSYGMLRLHVVEVSPEHEPPLLEEEEPVEEEESTKSLEPEVFEADDTVNELAGETVTDDKKREKEDDKKTEKEDDKKTEKGHTSEKDDPELKEVEMDDWLFEFAQLFRSHVGIDADAHIDLHELGMEMCSEALEETVTSEDAQSLFDKASLKFQEVAALAFFNWGNVHMCAARKRIPIDDSDAKDIVATQLQAAYEWVKEKYELARKKYEEALSIKPDFYEGLLALGQQQFEMAKLHWSFVLAKKEDLSKWDPTDTIKLFDSAEEKMKSATEMWEKLEEQRAKELKDPNTSKKEDLAKRRKKQAGGNEGDDTKTGGEVSAVEAAEQAAVMRSQIHLFWGNMLFERSQVECKLGLNGWEKHLETSVEQFKLAGASEVDISTVLKNHCSNAEAAEGGDKKVKTPSSDTTEIADDNEKANRS